MGKAKILTCINCNCLLGTIYKAKLQKKCNYICQDCLDKKNMTIGRNAFDDSYKRKNNFATENLKNIFGFGD